jgi:hypothetical protein
MGGKRTRSPLFVQSDPIGKRYGVREEQALSVCSSRPKPLVPKFAKTLTSRSLGSMPAGPAPAVI